MCKIITYFPVKNDAWFIEKSVKSALLWSDHVFIFDDSSSDGCHEIYNKLLNVHENLHVMFERPKFDFTSSDGRNFYLNFIRNKIKGFNLIFELHADEIMSALILEANFRKKLLDLPIGTTIMLPWINLWEKPFLFRKDRSVWSNNYGWFGFKDDRKSYYNGAAFHGSRVPENLHVNKVTLEIPVLHFQFINLSMERSKQALYQIFERNHYPKKNIQSINKLYACAFDERSIKLIQLENKHYLEWLNRGIKINYKYEEDKLNWRDFEVLKNFNLYGVDKYKELNIWYINWETKRQLMIKENLLPEFALTKIKDPRNFETKIAHWFLMRYQKYPFWKFDVWRLVFNKLYSYVTK